MAGAPIQYLQIKLSNGIQKHLITDKVSAFKNSKRWYLQIRLVTGIKHYKEIT